MVVTDWHDGNLLRALSFLGAIVIFLLGFLCVILSAFLLTSDDFHVMDNMLRADEAMTGKYILSYTVDKAAHGVIGIGIVSMTVAGLGCFGIELGIQALICTYFLGLTALSVCFLFTLLAVTNFSTVLVPTVQKQASDFCSVSKFYTIKEQLGCTFPASRPGGICNWSCESLVEQINEMGGCKLLDDICHNFDWRVVGHGLCLTVDGKRPPTWISQDSMSAATCKTVCQDHVSCSAFAYDAVEERCYPVTSLAPTTTGDWKQLPTDIDIAAAPAMYSIWAVDNGVSKVCQKKDQPSVVIKADSFASLVTYLAGCAICITSLALACTCILVCSTSTRRKGERGAAAFVQSLLCPCLRRRERRPQPLPRRDFGYDEGDEDHMGARRGQRYESEL